MQTLRIKDRTKNGWWDRVQVAEYFGISVRTLDAWIREGILPHPTRFGRTRRWSRKYITNIEENAKI